jgi:hypothetical protein
MEIDVLRFNDGEDSTNGLLFINGKFECYTLEDEHRDSKVRGETRIPAGEYDIKLRKEGGFHAKYSKRFSDIHDGMLHIVDVPGFEYILIHAGNTDEHTAGCLLVGDSQENNNLIKDGFIGKSTQAYKRVYKKVIEAINNGEDVVISYTDPYK